MKFGFVVVLLSFALLFAQKESAPKVTLYLGGGTYSPWYSLGVLYAVRDYRIPVDSVVGVSWGAYVGALWSAGFELDDIQRILTDSHFTALLSPKNSPDENSLFHLPIAMNGKPSLAFRYAFFGDSLGYAHFRSKKLEADSAFTEEKFFRFQIEESLLRADSFVVPFTALICDGGKLRAGSVKESLPFSKTSGENCPTFLPADSSAAIYVSAHPLRNNGKDSPFLIAGFENELEQIHLRKENSAAPIVLIRPHSFSEDSPLALMQTGYADVEKKRGEFAAIVNEERDRSAAKDSILPRFQIEPSFENFSSAYYSHISSFWNPADTGMQAPKNFLKKMEQSPFYDSVQIAMDSLGIAKVSGFASSVLEFRVGGFGSNISGPLAYAGMDFRYIDQFEYAFSLDAFVGEYSYAVRPAVHIRGMLSGKGDLFLSGNISKKRPLKSYFSELDENLKIHEVRENDLTFGFAMKQNFADVKVSILLGESEFKTAEQEVFGTLHVNSLSPDLTVERKSENFAEWFGESGYRLRGNFGLRSVNLTAAGFGDAPLYISSTFDAEGEISPLSFFTLGAGAAGGVNIRRKSGEGYVYPDPLQVSSEKTALAVDNWYRLHPAISPWNATWNFSEIASHHYAVARAHFGLHAGFVGAWVFAAYMRDFEENPSVDLAADRFLFEPLLRFAYRSLDLRLGMSRIISAKDFSDFSDFDDYHYFFQVGGSW